MFAYIVLLLFLFYYIGSKTELSKSMLLLFFFFFFECYVVAEFSNKETRHQDYKQEAASIDAGISSPDSYPKTEPRL